MAVAGVGRGRPARSALEREGRVQEVDVGLAGLAAARGVDGSVVVVVRPRLVYWRPVILGRVDGLRRQTGLSGVGSVLAVEVGVRPLTAWGGRPRRRVGQAESAKEGWVVCR